MEWIVGGPLETYRVSSYDKINLLSLNALHTLAGFFLADVPGPNRKLLSALLGVLTIVQYAGLCGLVHWATLSVHCLLLSRGPLRPEWSILSYFSYLTALRLQNLTGLLIALIPGLVGQWPLDTWTIGRVGFLAAMVSCLSFLAADAAALGNGPVIGFLMPCTLRAITLVFDAKQPSTRKKENVTAAAAAGAAAATTDERREDALEARENDFDQLCYLACHVGILNTPILRYQTFKDHFADKFPTSRKYRIRKTLTERLPLLLFYAAFYYGIGALLPADRLSFMRSHSALTNVVFAFVSFNVYKARTFGVLLAGECSAIAVGMGAYPESWQPIPCRGPNLKRVTFEKDPLTFDAVKTVDLSSEKQCSLTAIFRKTNLTVQYFLANYIYKSLPGNRNTRIIFTFLISGIWHGLCFGQIGGYIQFAVFIIIEQRLPEKLKGGCGGIWWIASFVLSRCMMSYCHIMYELLHPDAVLEAYAHLAYFGHVIIIVIIFATWKRRRSDTSER